MENDEPLLFSSSSDEDEPEGEAAQTSQPITRKRPAGGHTPLDLASCQKVIREAMLTGCHMLCPSVLLSCVLVSLCPPVLASLGEEPFDLQKQSEVCLFQQQEDETDL